MIPWLITTNNADISHQKNENYGSSAIQMPNPTISKSIYFKIRILFVDISCISRKLFLVFYLIFVIFVFSILEIILNLNKYFWIGKS